MENKVVIIIGSSRRDGETKRLADSILQISSFDKIDLNEFLEVPKPLDKGKLTTKDLTKATSSCECIEQIKKWAEEVYHSWSSNHSIVSQIADGFLDNKYKRKTQGRKTTNR